MELGWASYKYQAGQQGPTSIPSFVFSLTGESQESFGRWRNDLNSRAKDMTLLQDLYISATETIPTVLYMMLNNLWHRSVWPLRLSLRNYLVRVRLA